MNIILALAMFVLACFTFNALMNQDQIQKPSNRSLLLISTVGMIELVYSVYQVFKHSPISTPTIQAKFWQSPP